MKTLVSVPKILSRSLSTTKRSQAMAWPKADYGPMEIQRSELMSGVRVAAAKPLGAYVAACTIMFQAGSRYEINDEIGATHFLRAMAACSGRAYTAYAKNRHLQQFGASLFSCSDRQTISYTLRCAPSTFSKLKNYLLDAATRCSYTQWEINDRKALIKDDLARIRPAQRAMDLLQSAMWAGPLANSMFCSEERIDDMTEATLNTYTKWNFKTDVCTVASVGVPFEETLKLAEKIEPRKERPMPRGEVRPSSARGGFEQYDLGKSSETWIALGIPGTGTSDLRNMVKHSIIASACGTGPISQGQHAMDNTPQPPLGLMVGGNPHTEYRAFNISYNNSGVFELSSFTGILAKAESSMAKSVAMSAAEFLASVNELSFRQIEIGKKRLKVSLSFNDDVCVNFTQGLALQLASNVQMDNASSTFALIESIPAEEVSATATQMSQLSAIMGVAVVGDVGAVPHDRDIVGGN